MLRQIHSDAMDLGDILSKEQIITDLQAGDRWQAIDELIKNLVSTGKIKAEHHDAIAAVVKKRESSMSTGIGFCSCVTMMPSIRCSCAAAGAA